jgi:hypothetical protein
MESESKNAMKMDGGKFLFYGCSFPIVMRDCESPNEMA